MMSGPVEFGLILALTIRGLALTSYDQMRVVSQRAEALGFDSIWLCDHFLTLSAGSYAKDAGMEGRPAAGGARSDAEQTSMPLLECWTTLSALARDTRRLRLGTSVLCNSYRSPSVLAKMAATLDVISEGRLELGLGAGWFEREYEAYGIPFPKTSVRIAQMDEGIEVIRRMWTDAYPTFKGTHYTIDGAICDPPPVQRPHPPIWIGGEGDKVHRVAARVADGINVRWWPPERFVQRNAFLEEACREHGRDPARLRRSLTALLAPSRERAAAEAHRRRFAAIPAAGLIVGTPEECVARILEYRKAGVTHFLFTIPDVAELDLLEVTGREVLPAVRAGANP